MHRGIAIATCALVRARSKVVQAVLMCALARARSKVPQCCSNMSQGQILEFRFFEGNYRHLLHVVAMIAQHRDDHECPSSACFEKCLRRLAFQKFPSVPRLRSAATQSCAVLRRVTLCYAVLRSATLSYAMLSYAVLCCAPLLKTYASRPPTRDQRRMPREP